jgi:hypothetical protein
LDVFSENLPSSPLVNSFLDPILSAKTSTIKITNFEYTVFKLVGLRLVVKPYSRIQTPCRKLKE